MVQSSDEERPAYVRAVSRESRYIHDTDKERARFPTAKEKRAQETKHHLKGGVRYG